MSPLKGANLALAFLLELVAMGVMGASGWHSGSTTGSRVLFAVGAVVGWAAVWGVFFSPKPAVALPAAAVAVGPVAMFAIAVAALNATGRIALAVVLAGAVVVNQVLLIVWHK